jgi:hypothetical protein
MTPRPIEILFENDRTEYQPGDELVGQFLVVPDDAQPLKAIEISVLWYSEGKGDEDLGIHHFERLDAQHRSSELTRPIVFRTRLPKSPLSYQGSIIKIVWCVRIRAFLQRGDNYCTEECFQLGTVPAAEKPAT